MRPECLTSARNVLQLVRDETDAIGVALSFGKDSLATLDLASRLFNRIEAYYLFRVEGLAVIKDAADRVRGRYGIAVRMYPHFDLCRLYRNAIMRPHDRATQVRLSVNLSAIEAHFRADADVTWIALGWRRNDSYSRAMCMRRWRGYDPRAHRVFPLRIWRASEVREYLTTRHIEQPPSLGRREQGGLDFHPGALGFLRDNYPADWARWLQDFPFAGAQLAIPEAKRAAHRHRTPQTARARE